MIAGYNYDLLCIFIAVGSLRQGMYILLCMYSKSAWWVTIHSFTPHFVMKWQLHCETPTLCRTSDQKLGDKLVYLHDTRALVTVWSRRYRTSKGGEIKLSTVPDVALNQRSLTVFLRVYCRCMGMWPLTVLHSRGENQFSDAIYFRTYYSPFWWTLNS